MSACQVADVAQLGDLEEDVAAVDALESGGWQILVEKSVHDAAIVPLFGLWERCMSGITRCAKQSCRNARVRRRTMDGQGRVV